MFRTGGFSIAKRFKCTVDNLIDVSQEVISELDSLNDERVNYLSRQLSSSVAKADKFGMVRQLGMAKRPLKHILRDDEKKYDEIAEKISVCQGGV